jgi:regulator of sirC expression with transglutaminase-like and TPR domain
VDPTDAFAELLGREDDEIALDRGALLIAAAEYPDLDLEAALAALDAYAERLRRRLRGLDEPEHVAHALAEVLHGELGFSGNPGAYYDPRNSYLSEVINRKLGIPISLSAVYLEVGRRAGLPLEGVGMPGHFLVRLDHPSRPLLLDPFADGMVISQEECAARLRALYGPRVRFQPEMLAAVSTRAILFRMLANLKGIYTGEGDWPRVIRTIDLMLIVEPGASSEYRDRGAAHMRTGRLRRARADFEHYLLNAIDVDDAGTVREQLALIERLDAMRN